MIFKGNKFLITKYFTFVARLENYSEQEISLYVSNSFTYDFEFYKANIPTRLNDKSYTILDSNEGQVFLHVNHLNDYWQYGNIYISSSSGTEYSLSLRNNVRTKDG